MTRYARIDAGRVAERPLDLPDGLTPSDAFRGDVATTFVECSDINVSEGWSWDGQSFSAPTPIAASVPQSVTSAQAKIQLRRAGLRDKVDAAVQAAGGEVLDWFTDARVWERDNPHVADIGTTLKLKNSDIDDLFVEAAKIAA